MNSITHWLEEHLMTCPYKALTGFDCPGCGMQRSFIELLKGDPVQSFHLYPALLPTIFTLLFMLLHLIFKFRNGAAVIKWSFIITIGIVVMNYLIKMLR